MKSYTIPKGTPLSLFPERTTSWGTGVTRQSWINFYGGATVSPNDQVFHNVPDDYDFSVHLLPTKNEYGEIHP